MLAQLAAVHESIEANGGSVIGVAPAAAYQAEGLMSSSIPFNLYIDTEQAVGKRVGIGKQSLREFFFNLPAWWRYIKALVKTRRQGRITGHYSNLPGITVVDGTGDVTYVYRGTGFGDYPPLETVQAELKSTLDSMGSTD
ncbi:MAG: hypothetical protein BMS9Abin12_2361 [Acidimicrobiia bacterium]|nr:MAG: hypothetical protein BMS9Abin12_2361 [Acidimicrobiia bacterium]